MYIPRDANITEHEFQLFRISIESRINSGHTATISSLISNNERAVSRDRWKKKFVDSNAILLCSRETFQTVPSDNTLLSLFIYWLSFIRFNSGIFWICFLGTNVFYVQSTTKLDINNGMWLFCNFCNAVTFFLLASFVKNILTVLRNRNDYSRK